MAAKPAASGVLQDKAFLILIVAVSLAFIWILLPYYGAIFWATVLAVMFAPLYRRLLGRLRERRTPAALATEAVVVLIVILPAALMGSLLVQEAMGVYQKMRAGEFSLAHYFQQVQTLLPAWAAGLLDRFGVSSPGSVQEKLMSGLAKGAQVIAENAFNFGQNTLDFVVSFFLMLYLLFFFLRDGDRLTHAIRDAIPLHNDLLQMLARRFTEVIRATVKGNLVVAAVQGLLGGLIFWVFGIHAPVLWGVVMAFMSLLPAGSGVVWLPVAIYLIATGAVWKGIILIVYGAVVIGVVDNVLRPLLVGKGTRMPDYLVLLSTLGGLAIFGFNGFVIGPLVAALFLAGWHIVAVSGTGASEPTRP